MDRVPCNLKRVVFENSQERFIRILFYNNSFHVCELPINFNSKSAHKVYLSVPFFGFEHHIRPDQPSAVAHGNDDDDFMPFPNTRSSSHIDKSKDVGLRKTRQTRAGLSTGACTEVPTIYLLLHFHFTRVTILKLLFIRVISLFCPSIYHEYTFTYLLSNLYFSIFVLLSATLQFFFQLHYPCISLPSLHPLPQLLVFI